MCPVRGWWRSLAALLVAVLSLTACIDLDPDPSYFTIVETDLPLVVGAPPSGSHPLDPNGDSTTISAGRCIDTDIVAMTEDGSEFARLTEDWCPDGIWRIRADGESVLDPTR
jgi:hypothetical protein